MHNYKKYMALIGLAGFLAGIIYSNMISGKFVSEVGIFNEYFLNRYVQSDILTIDYVVYITKIRMLYFLVLVLLGCTKFRRFAAGLFLAWTGFSCGMLMTAAVLKMGLKGLILCITALIPHVFFYFAAYLMLLLYFIRYPESKWNVSKSLCVVLFMSVGILLECYVNPVIMQWFVGVL